MGYLDNAGLAYFWGKVKAILPGGSSGGVPVGTIVIWSGTAEDIPEGWALCDGQDGRPDLRDKFVLGAGANHAVGETGGSETVTLTVEQMPAHGHVIDFGFYSEGATFHTLDSQGVQAGRTKSYNTGGSQPHENMPPYYALCYIIKTAEDSGGESAREVYSTEETRIGTWINGKPLYRRVFETSIAAMGSYENIVSFPNSYETKTLKGYVSVPGGIVPVPSYSPASNIGTYLYSVSGGVSAYTTNKAHVNTTCTVIVEYTKATDEGGTS